MTDAWTTERLEVALGTHELVDLADAMRIEGFTQVQVEEIFSNFRMLLLDQGREANADEVADILALIVGYCAPGARLFPPDRYKPIPGLLKFFAAPDDRPAVVKFIFEGTHFEVFRRSAPDRSRMRIAGLTEYVPETDNPLCLWNACVGSSYEILDPTEYHQYWFTSDPSFTLYFGDVRDNVLVSSQHSIAFRRGPSSEAFALLEPLRNFIVRVSTASALGVPVLPRALALTHHGHVLKEEPNTRWEYKID